MDLNAAVGLRNWAWIGDRCRPGGKRALLLPCTTGEKTGFRGEVHCNDMTLPIKKSQPSGRLMRRYHTLKPKSETVAARY